GLRKCCPLGNSMKTKLPLASIMCLASKTLNTHSRLCLRARALLGTALCKCRGGFKPPFIEYSSLPQVRNDLGAFSAKIDTAGLPMASPNSFGLQKANDLFETRITS